MNNELWDTSIYVIKLRKDPNFLQEEPQEHIYLSSVVVGELATGFVYRKEILPRFEECVEFFRKNSRLITPTNYDWYLSGIIIGEIISRRPDLKNKKALLFNDCLIATSSRVVKAKVATANRLDFQLIRKWLNFDVEYLD